MRNRLAKVLGTDGVPILLAFVIVAGYFTVAVPSFADGDSLRYYLNEEVPVFIIAAGLALVIIAGGIDLSVGAVLGLSAGISLLASMNGWNAPMASLAGLATGLTFGIVNGFVIVKLKLNDFMVTLGTLNIAAGLLVVLTDRVQLVGTSDEAFLSIATTRVVGVTSAMVLALLVVVLLQLLLMKTTTGRLMVATGLGAAPALIAGVHVARIKFMAYVISGALAGLGGVVLASRLNSVQAGMAGGYELAAIAAAVLGGVSLAGGRGSIWGAAVGRLAPGHAEAGLPAHGS